MAALRDFRAIALGAGATSILAVATSAVREAANGTTLVERARRELGMRVVIIDGEREATFAFLGAVHGLPVDHGLLFDLGGGSLEVSQFRDRKLVGTWTLPLGALRLSDRFLGDSDRPSPRAVRRLRDHVTKTLRKAGIPRLGRDEQLIGTGGTVRNLAKMEARTRRDPLPHVHGFVLEISDVRSLVQRTASLGKSARGAIPGLNRDRADSIAGGFLAPASGDGVRRRHRHASLRSGSARGHRAGDAGQEPAAGAASAAGVDRSLGAAVQYLQP